MADRSAASTFRQTVMGNRRVVYVDVPGGGTTNDSLVIPHVLGIDFVSACFRSSVFAATSVSPSCSFEGTTVQIFQPAATTASNYTVRVEGR